MAGHDTPEVLLEERFHPGEPGRPLVILLHGHGASQRVFTDPYAEWMRDRDDKRMLPFDFVLTDFGEPDPEAPYNGPGRGFGPLLFSTPLRLTEPDRPCLWDALAAQGYALFSWSQREPNGPVAHAIDELRQAVPRARELAGDRPWLLVGHSRGGLVCRAWLQSSSRADREGLRGILQLGSPNRGSRIAGLLRVVGQVVGMQLTLMLLRAVPRSDRNRARHIAVMLAELLEYLRSRAIEELRPRSSFIRELNRGTRLEIQTRVPMHVLAGNSPAFTRVFYRWGEGRSREIFAVSRGMPAPFFPPEVRDGMGDGLVAVTSAFALEHVVAHPPYPVNHGTILNDPAVVSMVLHLLTEMEEGRG